MVAGERILVSLTNICANPDVFYYAIKLYLVALNAFLSESAEHTDSVSNYVTKIKDLFVTWFKTPSAGFEDSFGGKNGKKIKTEIKV